MKWKLIGGCLDGREIEQPEGKWLTLTIPKMSRIKHRIDHDGNRCPFFEQHIYKRTEIEGQLEFVEIAEDLNFVAGLPWMI